MRRISLFITAIFSLSYSVIAFADKYEFSFAPNIEQDPVMMEAIFLEKRILNKQEISVYQTKYENNIEGSWIKTPVTPFSTKLNAEILEQFDLYAVPFEQMILVPKNWQLLNGSVGVNGSISYVFTPKIGKGYLSYYHAGACVGCAMISASAFFPEAQKDAKEHDFAAYTATVPPLSQVRLKPHLMAYQVNKGKDKLDGVAYYNLENDGPFWKAEVFLPESQQKLATPLLNQFIREGKQ
ncbi:TPA: DUF4850 domain-containing protein [Pasteurella multocida]|nr:DUF4850 domain-containing protein [Pasteurella multocida]HED4436276.1 DUF4850 domain-containing protein [Pasteurella multocida]